jgi:hypothetical protein
VSVLEKWAATTVTKAATTVTKAATTTTVTEAATTFTKAAATVTRGRAIAGVMVKAPHHWDALHKARGRSEEAPNSRGEDVEHTCLIILVDAGGQAVNAKVRREVVVIVGFPI